MLQKTQQCAECTPTLRHKETQNQSRIVLARRAFMDSCGRQKLHVCRHASKDFTKLFQQLASSTLKMFEVILFLVRSSELSLDFFDSKESQFSAIFHLSVVQNY
jgi:hypothetical protein